MQTCRPRAQDSRRYRVRSTRRSIPYRVSSSRCRSRLRLTRPSRNASCTSRNVRGTINILSCPSGLRSPFSSLHFFSPHHVPLTHLSHFFTTHHASLNCSPFTCPMSTRRLISRAVTGSSAAKLQYHAHSLKLRPLYPHPPSCMRHKIQSLCFRDINNDRCALEHTRLIAGTFETSQMTDANWTIYSQANVCGHVPP